MKKAIISAIAACFISQAASAFPGSAPDRYSEGIAQTVMTRYPSALNIPFKPW